MLEKLSFNASCNVSGVLDGKNVAGYMAPDCVLGNTIGLVLAASLVAIVVALWEAKHPAAASTVPGTLTDEAVPLLSGNGAKAQADATV